MVIRPPIAEPFCFGHNGFRPGSQIMNILLAFAPFLVFAALDRLTNPLIALIAAAITAIVLLFRSWLLLHESPKLLDIGTIVLFAGLAAYSAVTQAQWSIAIVRLCVDLGLLLIVLLSLAVRRPFTLQYARESIVKNVRAESIWTQPGFIRTNYVITAVWALAFTLMVAADCLMLYLPSLPVKVSVGITILALVGAIRFTSWYPAQARVRAVGNLSAR